MRYVKLSEIHEHVAKLQKASGLSVKDFGARYDLSRPTMSNIVNGNTQPSKQLLDALGLELYVGVPAKSKKRE